MRGLFLHYHEYSKWSWVFWSSTCRAFVTQIKVVCCCLSLLVNIRIQNTVYPFEDSVIQSNLILDKSYISKPFAWGREVCMNDHNHGLCDLLGSWCAHIVYLQTEPSQQEKWSRGHISSSIQTKLFMMFQEPGHDIHEVLSITNFHVEHILMVSTTHYQQNQNQKFAVTCAHRYI